MTVVVLLHNSFRLDFIPLVHSLFVLFDNWQPVVPRRSWDKREQQQSWEFPELLDTLCIPNWYNRLAPEHRQIWPKQNPVVVLPCEPTCDVLIAWVVQSAPRVVSWDLVVDLLVGTAVVMLVALMNWWMFVLDASSARPDYRFASSHDRAPPVNYFLLQAGHDQSDWNDQKNRKSFLQLHQACHVLMVPSEVPWVHQRTLTSSMAFASWPR